MSPKKSNKTVGVIGLGIMGGSFSRNLVKAGWRVVGFDIDAAKRKELAKAGVEIAGSAKAVAAAAPDHHHQPAEARGSDRHREGNRRARSLPRRIIAECSTFTIEDKEKAEKVLRAAGHVMLDCPVSGTGSQARTGDLVIYASGDPKSVAQGQADVRRLLAQALRRRRLRQRQPDEICRQPPGRDQQRRLGRSHGDGHEGRARSENHLRDDLQRRRQFARVRAARADDGEERLQRRHHEMLGVAEGHGRDRRLRQEDARADAAVFRDAAGLCRGAQKRPRRGRHRRGLRRAGGQGATSSAARRGESPSRGRTCCPISTAILRR